MPTVSSDRYGWVDREYDLALTMAVVHGRTISQLVRHYGGDPAAPVGRLVYTDALNYNYTAGEGPDDLAPVVMAFEHQGAVIAIEPSGWTGSLA